jgi:hypothetical protein
MSQAQCRHCGDIHADGAAFCPSTGRPLNAAGAPLPAPPVAPPSYASGAPVAPPPYGSGVPVAPPHAREHLGPARNPQDPPDHAPGGYPQGGWPGYGQGAYPHGGAQGYAQPPQAAYAPPARAYPQPPTDSRGQMPPGMAQNGYAAPYAARAPVGAVRHSYPLTVRDASFSSALGLVLRTMPYALARFGVLFAVSIATLVWYVVAFGGWALASRISGGLGFAWFVVCCAVYGWLWTLVVRYFLYLLKCGHIAVLTELMTRGNLNLQGKGMFAYGKDVVRSRFGEVSVLFVVDRLVSGVVRSFNRTLDFVANLLPVPGLSSIVSVVNSVLYAATTYLDETIFSYGLARNETNPWASAKDGLIYYAQNSKEILKTALWIVVLDKVFTAIVWAIMLVPAFLVTWVMPRSVVALGVWFAFGFAAMLAANVRSAFIKPIFLVMIMSKFHVQIENQPINAEWDARLSGVSDKFREIDGKARGYVPGLVPAV